MDTRRILKSGSVRLRAIQKNKYIGDLRYKMRDTSNTNNMSETTNNSQINENENETVVRGKGSRILAWVLIGIYAVLLGLFIYFIISGSQYILQMLFVLIIYPVFLYIIVWLRKVFDK